MFFPPVCFPEATCSHLKVFIPLSSTVMQNFVHTPFFQACHFLGMLDLQMEQHTFILNKILLNNHTYYSLMQGGTQLNRLYSTHMQCHKFVLVMVLPSVDQSRNYLITSCTLTQTLQIQLRINNYMGIQMLDDIMLYCYIWVL